MTSGARLYAVLAAVVVFFLTWATVAAHPWQTPTADRRLVALEQRRLALQHESLRVRRILQHRWAVYRVALAKHQRLQAQIAARARAQQQVITVTQAPAQLASSVVAAPPVVPAAPATATHTS